MPNNRAMVGSFFHAFTPANENDDSIPRFKFDSNPVSQQEILEATKALQPKTYLDHNGLSTVCPL